MLPIKLNTETGEEIIGKIKADEIDSSVNLDKNYVHEQIIPSTNWTITHNLNKVPSVTILDSSNRDVKGEMEVINNNEIVLSFNGAFSGKAHLN